MKKNVYFADLVLCNRVLIPCERLDLASDGVVSSAAVFGAPLPTQRGSIAWHPKKRLRWRLRMEKLHLVRYFWITKSKSTKTNYGMMLFTSKQVILPKISSILQKIRSRSSFSRSSFSRLSFSRHPSRVAVDPQTNQSLNELQLSHLPLSSL